MKHEQKYFTEVSLLQTTKLVMPIKPAELTRLKGMPHETVSILNGSHVYFICQRPRIRIIETGRLDTEGIPFKLEVGGKCGAATQYVHIPKKHLPSGTTEAKSYENGSYFTLTNGDNETDFLPIEHLLPILHLPDLQRLEVLYIGKAYGDSGLRSSVDRLKSHTMLQKILADQSQSSWWMEPIILLFVYNEPQLSYKMDGLSSPEIFGEEDISHFRSIQDEPLSEAQLVSIAEASLIRYFRPRYNTHFKGHYPTTNTKHLQEAYRLDYNAITTVIDTGYSSLTVFSEEQSAVSCHIAQFDLHDPADRRSFFELPAPSKEGKPD